MKVSAGAERRARREERRARRAEVTDPDVVMAAGAALLAARPRTTQDLRGRLVALGYAVELVDRTVERLLAIGYLDDAGYARAWIASRDRSRPRGASALRRELLHKGVERDLVDAALAERDTAAADATAHPADDAEDGTADLAAATRLLERRRATLLRESDPRKARQRVYALLARNGFDPDICGQATRAFTLDSDHDHDEMV